MSAKTDYVKTIVGELDNTKYSNVLPVKAAISKLATDVYDASGLVPVDGSCTNAKLANMATKTIKGKYTAGTGAPEDITVTEMKILLGAERVEIVTDNRTVVAADSGMIFGCGTDAKVFSLPATAAGLKYTFVNTGAAGHNALTISPVAADGISGTITLASSVVVDAGVVNKDLINTKATACAGDSVTIIGTGVTGTTAWIILNSTGIWAAEG